VFEWLAETASNVVNAVVDFVTGGSAPAPSTDPCEQGACGAARRERDAARRNSRNACNWVTFLMAPLRAAIWVVSRPLRDYVIALVVLFVVAQISGIILGIAIYGMALLFIRAWIPVITQAGQVLGEASQRELAAIAAVQRDCPANCQGDLTPSECDPIGEGNVLPNTPFDRFLGLDRFTVTRQRPNQ
jgi:hypothetical protein